MTAGDNTATTRRSRGAALFSIFRFGQGHAWANGMLISIWLHILAVILLVLFAEPEKSRHNRTNERPSATPSKDEVAPKPPAPPRREHRLLLAGTNLFVSS